MKNTNGRICSEWIPEQKLVITQLSGDVITREVINWEKSLLDALEQIPDNYTFKILVNLYGFKAANIHTHKCFRTVVPLTLAQYGWKVGYTNLFKEEAGKIKLSCKNGIRCIAAAHVHQDASKINLYEKEFATSSERYFTDSENALTWITNL